MNTLRRTVLAAAALLAAGAARAQLKTDDPEASPVWQKLRVQKFAGPLQPAGDRLLLEAPARAEDAAVVPIAVRTRQPAGDARRVRKLTLVIDNNPSPVAAEFEFFRASGGADIETRVRVDEYTHIRAIAELDDGTRLMALRFVKASGGCSAPPTKDAVAAAASMGRMRLRVDGTPMPGQPLLAQLMVSHPNHSGLVMNQSTRQYTPAHFVRRLEVRYAGEPVLAAELDFAISENPNFRFWFLPSGAGKLEAEVVDTRDLHFETTLDLKPAL